MFKSSMGCNYYHYLILSKKLFLLLLSNWSLIFLFLFNYISWYQLRDKLENRGSWVIGGSWMEHGSGKTRSRAFGFLWLWSLSTFSLRLSHAPSTHRDVHFYLPVFFFSKYCYYSNYSFIKCEKENNLKPVMLGVNYVESNNVM